MTSYIIRDDIINVDTYYQAEVHYKQYLEQLYDAGYYCFQAQWSRLHKNPKILKGMRDAGLVAVDAWSGQFNVIRLTQAALKYMTYRDEAPEKLEGKRKDQLTVRTIAVRPNNGPLLASAMRYELIVRMCHKYEVRRCALLARGEGLRYVEGVYRAKIQARPQAADYLQDDYVRLCHLITTLYDTSKVIVFENNGNVKAMVLDVAHRDPQAYESLLQRLETLVDRVCNKPRIHRYIVTTSAIRAKAFGGQYHAILLPELGAIYEGKVTTDKWVKPKDGKLANAIRDRVQL